MNLYQYYKALSMNKNKMMNPVLISEDVDTNMAVISYNHLAPQFSWDIPLILNARGLVLDMKTGDIVSRPYPKFFNYQENEYAYWPDNTEGMSIEEKLDGSLVIVSTYKDQLIISSSGSLTSDHANIFKEYINNNLSEYGYNTLFEMGKTHTLLFEYVSPDNKIVLQYPNENMILHGAIQTLQEDDGPIKELSHSELEQLGNEIGVDVIKQYPLNSFNDIQQVLNSKTNFEGFVVKFPDGHRLKFKTDEYVRKHRIATNLDLNVDSRKLRETFVQSIIHNSYDDLIPYLTTTQPLLNDMIEHSRQFIEAATKRKTSYLKENEHLTIVDSDINAIKNNLLDLSKDLTNNVTKFNKQLSTYMDNISDTDLLAKGYMRIVNMTDEKQSSDKKIITKYKNANIANGLINTQELDKKQKRLVSQIENETVIDKHIKKYLMGNDLMTVLEDYLNDAYINNFKQSEIQKYNQQLRTLSQIEKQVDKTSISKNLSSQFQQLFEMAQQEILDKKNTIPEIDDTHHESIDLNLEDLNDSQNHQNNI